MTGCRWWLRGSVSVLVTLVIAGLCALVPSGAHGAPDPASQTRWLCSPSMSDDPCDLPLDTTDLRTGRTVTPSVPAESRKPVDCFYVYPTVSNEVSLNARKDATPEVRSIAEFQAARFRSQCRVFAPVYRQIPLVSVVGQMAGAHLADLAYRDVLGAWRDYLAHDNHGRGVILIGHSQGSLMLRKLMRENIDNDPSVRKLLVGAFLMGGNVTTTKGQTTGADFRTIPTCSRRGQSGCVVAYSTTMTRPPAGLSLFGNSDLDALSIGWGLPHGPRDEVACTDPAILSGDRSPVGITVPSKPYAFGFISVLLDYTAFPQGLPRSRSTWTTSRERTAGRCVNANGHRLYQFGVIDRGGQLVNEPPLFNGHLVDINLGYDRLVSIAAQQAANWSARH
ncbi:DUF3089 domain-containing protein [Gordonia sp. SID5947]|uniref:DUF3089 domain-containing protein n=1 Tax=Gordonia sp. SID5947 TaxID=2690315 RepID=UPI001369D15A|nr:DUF3089 domain-containing protein [Gordonia sp. SID5947]MYR08341.1 DUF3089 domain-containing protein [Gordonia sp. SID5947]